MEKAADFAGVTVNKNAVYGDTSAFTPGGVRLGTAALTSRGFVEADFLKVADFLDRVVKVQPNNKSLTQCLRNICNRFPWKHKIPPAKNWQIFLKP